MAVYGTPSERAFLDSIAAGETTSGSGHNYGYSMGFGGRTISDLSAHPYKPRQFATTMHADKFGGASPTSAAGRYQFQRGTWDKAARALGLTDFSPASQDKAALYLARQRGAGALIDRGDVKGALALKSIGQEWASTKSVLNKLNNGKIQLGKETPAVDGYASAVMGSKYGTAATPATPYVPPTIQNDALNTLQDGMIKPTDYALYQPPEVRPTAGVQFFEPDYKSLNAAVKQWSTF